MQEAVKDIKMFVAINKIDLVQPDRISEVSNALNEKYPEFLFVSASSGDGIDKFFKRIAELALETDSDINHVDLPSTKTDISQPSSFLSPSKCPCF